MLDYRKACQLQTLWLIRHVCKLQRKLSVVNTAPGMLILETYCCTELNATIEVLQQEPKVEFFSNKNTLAYTGKVL
jgi:hypothetical protein